jgi:hypothetical protein
MALPVTIPNEFANATASIPLSQLDTNFTTLANAVNGISDGSETLANVTATVVNATTVDTTNIQVTNIKAKDGTAAGSIADSTGVVTLASSVLTTTDINGGTIDGTVIGGSTAAAGSFTTLGASSTATFAAGAVGTPAITTTGDTNTGIFFPAADTIAFAEGGAEAMRIDSSGNVRMGDNGSNPTDTDADNLIVANASGAAGIQITSSSSSVGKFVFGDADSARSGMIYYSHISDFMRFDTGATEAMRIDSSGNLLVGTTATVSGCLGSFFKASGSILGTESTDTGATNHLVFENPNGIVGTIQVTGSATAYVTSSDYRLKENVAPMTGALAKVLELNPVTYTWKVDGSSGEGFIAHELQAVCPDAVTGEKDAVETKQVKVSPAVPATYDEEGNELTPAVEAVYEEREVPKHQGVDTSFLVATLTAAIQELKAINDAQASRIETLEAKVAALEAR